MIETVNTMETMRRWIKKRFTTGDLHENRNKGQLHGVITPSTIPKFVIPGMDLEEERPSYYNENNNEKESSPGLTMSKSLPITAEEAGLTCDGTPEEDHLNMAALSLPHIRTQTPYGFPTVRELPNTRRKESLFLGSDSSVGLKKFSQASMTGIPSHLFANRSSSSNLLRPNIPGAGLGGSDVSPIGTPEGSPNFRRLYNRRRSSITKLQLNDEASLSDSASSGFSEIHQRFSHKQRSLTAPQIALQTKEEASRIAVLGEVKFSIRYCVERRAMFVLLIKGENLGKRLTDANQVNTYVSMCLMPSKQSKQSGTVRGTRDPSFQELFEFGSLEKRDLQRSTLRLRVYNKSPNHLRKSECLGEIMLPLVDLHLEQGEEVRMWRDLDEKSKYQVKGEMSVGLCFEPSSERLSVNIHSASSLPRTKITGGLPETYVKVSVSQPLRDSVSKSTHHKKDTVSPVYNESFAFHISPRVEDVHFTTVHISVYSKETLRTDSLIGRTVLGYESREERETRHWNAAVDSPGKWFTDKHNILITFQEFH